MRIPYKIKTAFKIGKNWLLFIAKDARHIKFLAQWIFSFMPEEIAHEKGFPLFTFGAKQWLDSFLTPEMNVFEWGSGGSTIFFSKKANLVVSLEHNPKWYEIISKSLKKMGLSATYILKEPKPGAVFLSASPRYEGLSFEEYCRVIDTYPDNYFDLVSIDGKARPSCVAQSLGKIKVGGYLLLDDSNNPDYAEAIKLLSGWLRKDFAGPKPCIINFHQTTIWQKHVSLSAK